MSPVCDREHKCNAMGVFAECQSCYICYSLINRGVCWRKINITVCSPKETLMYEKLLTTHIQQLQETREKNERKHLSLRVIGFTHRHTAYWLKNNGETKWGIRQGKLKGNICMQGRGQASRELDGTWKRRK